MYVALNISATSIRLLSFKGKRVKKWGSVPLEPGLVKDGVILQPKKAGAAIDALFRSVEIPKERVITSLTGLSFTYRTLSLPRMKPALTEEAIYRAASKEMPLPLDELYLSWQVIGGGDNEVDYFALGVPRNLIDAVEETLAEAGIKPYLMDLKPLALTRAASYADALIVALEPDCFDIVLVAGGIPEIMHTITPRGEGTTLEDNIHRLIDELSKTVEFYNSSHSENPLGPTTPLLVTGELAVDTATMEFIQAQVEYPVEVLEPPIEFPPYLPVAFYATNMGLALKKTPQKTVARLHDINFNILSDRQKKKAPLVPRRYIVLALALVVASGLLPPIYQAWGQARAETVDLRAELAVISQELRQTRLAANEAKQFEETIESRVEEIAAGVATLKQEWQDILSGGGDFTDNLELISDAAGGVASDLYFTSIEIGSEQIFVEGEADSPFTVFSYTKALETQGGYSEVRIVAIDESENTQVEGTGGSFIIDISK